MKLDLVYFAWVRERIGKEAEALDLDLTAPTVADVLAALTRRGENYAHALGEPDRLRFAIDQDFALAGARVPEGAELAIFPPVTGGGSERANPVHYRR